jgi:hypothetical protein
MCGPSLSDDSKAVAKGDTLATLLPLHGCSSIAVILVVNLILCWVLTQGWGANGRATYVSAMWQYVPESRFDNTWPTYLTDYFLTAMCFTQCWMLLTSAPKTVLRDRIAGILVLYGVSTLVGGLAHHFYDGNFENLNTMLFRLSWSIVVGTVAAAGALQGLVCTELHRRRAQMKLRDPILAVPVFSEQAWTMWGIVLTSMVAGGVFSFIRPAADIFLAGCTQTFPTFYIIITCLTFRNTVPHRLVGLLVFGHLGNTPLIFIYPWFVQQSGWTLGMVNFMLHCVLAMSWGLQGWALTDLCKRLDRMEGVSTGRSRSSEQRNVAAPAQ